MRALLFASCAAAALLGGCTASDSPTKTTPTPTPAARAVCGSPTENGPLPDWATAGFSGDSSMPHVMGDRGEIVAAIFGYPLSAEVRPNGPNNKILWVAKNPFETGDLVIDAKLDGTEVAVSRSVPGGPGPSIIDLPQAGCWRMKLTWPGHTDTMDLIYQ